MIINVLLYHTVEIQCVPMNMHRDCLLVCFVAVRNRSILPLSFQVTSFALAQQCCCLNSDEMDDASKHCVCLIECIITSAFINADPLISVSYIFKERHFTLVGFKNVSYSLASRFHGDFVRCQCTIDHWKHYLFSSRTGVSDNMASWILDVKVYTR